MGTGHKSIQRPGSYIAKPNNPSLPEHFDFVTHHQPKNGKGKNCDEYKEFIKKHGYPNQWSNEWTVKNDKPSHDYGILEGPEESTYSYFLAQQTIKRIREFKKDDNPFFIWHSFYGPHHPWRVPEEYYDIYRNVEIPEWSNYHWDSCETSGPHQMNIHPKVNELNWSDWEEAIRHYYAYITLIDRQLGRIIDHLKEEGLYEETLIIFTADHGETLGSHGGLTNKGWSHFEEIQRVPLILDFPKNMSEKQIVSPESHIKELVSLVDLYPTILDYANVEFCQEQVQGHSLLPLLQSEPVNWRDTVFVEFFALFNIATTMITARKGNFKYGWNCTGRDELYDLENDPFEMNNLIDKPEYKEKVKEMRQVMIEWANCNGVRMRGWDSPTNYEIPAVLK